MPKYLGPNEFEFRVDENGNKYVAIFVHSNSRIVGGDYEVLMDEEDYEDFMRTVNRRFCIAVRGAVTFTFKCKRGNLLHRWVMRRDLENYSTPENWVVDHKNLNPFDNRRSNLEIVTVLENNQNRPMHVTNKTGYRGVHLSRGKYRAHIGVDKKAIYLGTFDTAEEASSAYEKAREKFFTYATAVERELKKKGCDAA